MKLSAVVSRGWLLRGHSYNIQLQTSSGSIRKVFFHNLGTFSLDLEAREE